VIRKSSDGKGRSPFKYTFREIAPYIDLGMRLAVSLTVGVLGGLWLDRRLHTTPLFLLLGFFLGAGSGFWSIYRAVYRPDETDHETDERKFS